MVSANNTRRGRPKTDQTPQNPKATIQKALRLSPDSATLKMLTDFSAAGGSEADIMRRCLEKNLRDTIEEYWNEVGKIVKRS